jgi:endonuclease/exonuclease/phosphatase (EEP) superfamily protein YafD
VLAPAVRRRHIFARLFASLAHAGLSRTHATSREDAMTVRAEAPVGVLADEPAAGGRLARNLLWLGVLGLTGATALCLLARLWWVFELATHFRLHYVQAAAVLVLWALLMRRYVAAVVSAICGAVHAVWLLPLFLAPVAAAPVDEDAVTLRLATVNMQWSNPTPERVIAVLDQYRPDIVALQETTPWWPDAPAAVHAAYPYQAPLAWQLGRSVTLISRYPILAHEMRSGGGMRLQFPVLTIDVEGTVLTVIAVHPPHQLRPHHVPVYRRYLENLAVAVREADTPIVVLGDFNTTAFSPTFQDLLATTGLRDAADGFGYIATWPAALGAFGIPIDHVLVSPEFAVDAVDTGSDHAPVIVDMRLAAAAS